MSIDTEVLQGGGSSVYEPETVRGALGEAERGQAGIRDARRAVSDKGAIVVHLPVYHVVVRLGMP